MKKRKIKSLIFGISGQDGSYLSHFLINKGYDVYGTTRNRLKTNTKKFIRKKDIKSYRSDPRLAKKILKWKAKTSFKQIVKKMIYDELF